MSDLTSKQNAQVAESERVATKVRYAIHNLPVGNYESEWLTTDKKPLRMLKVFIQEDTLVRNNAGKVIWRKYELLLVEGKNNACVPMQWDYSAEYKHSTKVLAKRQNRYIPDKADDKQPFDHLFLSVYPKSIAKQQTAIKAAYGLVVSEDAYASEFVVKSGLNFEALFQTALLAPSTSSTVVEVKIDKGAANLF